MAEGLMFKVESILTKLFIQSLEYYMLDEQFWLNTKNTVKWEMWRQECLKTDTPSALHLRHSTNKKFETLMFTDDKVILANAVVRSNKSAIILLFIQKIGE